MQLGHIVPSMLVFGCGAVLQPLLQQFRKKLMITVPTPFVVQRYDKQISRFKVFQHMLCRNSEDIAHPVSPAAENRFAQRTAQSIKDGSTQ
ncbi:hypothetical protein D1872_298620 [compost metagenome]